MSRRNNKAKSASIKAWKKRWQPVNRYYCFWKFHKSMNSQGSFFNQTFAMIAKTLGVPKEIFIDKMNSSLMSTEDNKTFEEQLAKTRKRLTGE